MGFLKSIAETPVPTILVIAGIVFLFLAVGGQIGAKIVADKIKQKQAGMLGIVLLAIGLAFYWLGGPQTSEPVPVEQEMTVPEINARIQELEADIRRIEQDEEKARAEIERLQPFLETDRDAPKAIEKQEKWLHDLANQKREAQDELDRLRHFRK